ncbi:MAG TPA: alpha/beta fold hydrolase [Verrucomicrobiales bacterium]|nr:alpha/beta fold hydrolase [Verrucomicrobiales bacterium]
MKRARRYLGLRRLAAGMGLLVSLAAAGLWFRPLGLNALQSRAEPAPSREEALRILQGLTEADPAVSLPICRTTLLEHGAQSELAVVLLHGFTNCPEQFRMLGTILYEAGCNVVIPLTPDHGSEDRMTMALAGLTAEEMTVMCDLAVDAAAGLGRRTVVVGLSSGGTMAAWVAQHRAVERVLVLSPVAGVPGLSPVFTRPATSFALLWPNRFWWWDAELKEGLPGPPYAYPRFATRGMAEVLRLGLHVLEEASRSAPRSNSIVLVTNGSDTAVNFDSIALLRREWTRSVGGAVENVEFPAEEHLHHDLIDPLQVDAKIGRVYPELLALILQAPKEPGNQRGGEPGSASEAGSGGG